MATAGQDALRWQCSSFCNGGECLEIARRDDAILVRNCGDPGRWLCFSTASWHDFVSKVKGGSPGYGS
jgi:hypothetical protein